MCLEAGRVSLFPIADRTWKACLWVRYGTVKNYSIHVVSHFESWEKQTTNKSDI